MMFDFTQALVGVVHKGRSFSKFKTKKRRDFVVGQKRRKKKKGKWEKNLKEIELDTSKAFIL